MEKKRANALSNILKKDFIIGEGRTQERLTFSEPMIHGKEL